MNTGLVGNPAHQAVQSIDLTNQMAFAQSTNRRIAGHHADGFDLLRDERRARAHPRAGGSRFTAGVSTADDDHVKRSVHLTPDWIESESNCFT